MTSLLVAGRVLGLMIWTTVVAAGLFGSSFGSLNVAPSAVFVGFWVMVPVLCMVLGDVWRVLSPFETVASVCALGGARGRPGAGVARRAPSWSPVVAVAGVAGFVWVELVHPDRSSPRLLGGLVLGYSVLTVIGIVRYGRAWLEQGDGFTVLFGTLASVGMLSWDPQRGRLGIRPPGSGSSGVPWTSSRIGVLVVVIGSILFDGFTATTTWERIVDGRRGWDAVPLTTLGLVWAIVAVVVVYGVAVRISARGRSTTGAGTVDDRALGEVIGAAAPVLAPLTAGLVAAHGVAIVVIDGQTLIARASDPLGRGWDLFGTASRLIDYRIVSASTIAWLAVVMVSAGGVIAVTVGHDRFLHGVGRSGVARAFGPLLVALAATVIAGMLVVLE
jgi:hypothetical protein